MAGAASSIAGASFAGASSSAAGSGSSGGARPGSAGAGNDYVPTGAAVPPAGDERLDSGGSFEYGQGRSRDGDNDRDSFDHCGTIHPRAFLEQSGAPDGVAFMRLQSQFEPSQEVHPSDVDSQFAFWFQTPLPANEPLYLYFEIINLSARPPVGDITLARASGVCQTVEPLAAIPLDRLALSNQWQTRCVELHPTQAVPVLGWWAAGADFVIGVDEFRFGPPCHH